MSRKLLVLLAGLLTVPACSSDRGGEAEEAEEELSSPNPETAPRATEALTFRDACAGSESITVAAVGDVLMHSQMQRQAYAAEDGFRSTWKGALPLLEKADVTYANLEGPTAPGVKSSGTATADPGKRFDGVVYSGYPMFNYHPSLLDDLKASGVDIVSTANNHALDRRALGADKTLEELDRREIKHSGTRRQGTTDAFHTITEVKGFKIAWLACTFSTNGIPDNKSQVLRCFDGEQTNRSSANPDALRIIGELSHSSDVDAVIVTPHWGNEYEYKQRDFQVRTARAFVEAGAAAVIGGHPHVIQPWEKIATADGREGFILYSLGNFAAGQISSNGVPLLAQRTSLLLYVGLSRSPGKKAWVNGVKYVPLFMESDGKIYARPVTKDERVGSLAAKSYALSTRVFGEWDALPPDAEPKTNAECASR